jgi:hypothetical protein
VPTEDVEKIQAAFSLLPDINWRLWICVGLLIWFFASNPVVAWSVGKWLFSLTSSIMSRIMAAVGKQVPSVLKPSVDDGIDVPLRAAQETNEWAVRNGNQEVFNHSTATLGVLLKSKAAAVTVAALLMLTAGCSASDKSSEPAVEHHTEHSFGYTPPTSSVREQIYHAEPTLKQLEPQMFIDAPKN